MAAAGREFYRKPLPDSCIDFTSTEAKTIFKEALHEGTMNCFFNLAAQFRTQDEPAFCGLSTLVMVLNALSVDPGRVWKGPWRWYHESMLDCCVSLDTVKKEGITLYHFSCLAICNGLDVRMVQASPTATVKQFRDDVKRVTQSESQMLVCSYSRGVLGQTGDGHFSPIGGYHADRDLVLIFDVARFKYPPHWVSLDLLWKAMQKLDADTGQPRGYLALSRTQHTGNPTILFKISENFNLSLPSKMQGELSVVLQEWHDWLLAECLNGLEKNEFLVILITKFMSLWCTKCFQGIENIFIIKVDADCCKDLSRDHKCAIGDLLSALENLALFDMMNQTIRSGEHSVPVGWDDPENLRKINEQLRCPVGDKSIAFPTMIQFVHLTTMMLLAWPYPSKQPMKSVSHADFCVEYINQEMKSAPKVLEHEVKLLNDQLSTIFTYYKSVTQSQAMLDAKTRCCDISGCKKSQ